jgi:hypothetical protein
MVKALRIAARGPEVLKDTAPHRRTHMSNKPAFAEAIGIMVAKEVQAALAPYREALASLVEFAGAAPAESPRGGARTAPPSRNVRGPRIQRRGSAASLELVSKFVEGQKVQYRQGRGTFEARVVGIDAENGTVTLERINDRKTIVRPAAKVLAA